MIYFEAKGESLLSYIGMSKSEFAVRMGVKRQNVGALFKSKNIVTIRKVSEVLGVPFSLLVGYVEEPEIDGLGYMIEKDADETCIMHIQPEDIPTGSSVDAMRLRQKLIHTFYTSWKMKNPEQRLYNIDLRDYINIRYISIEETAAHASLSYLSTLAVLQLDAILVNSKIIKKVPSKHNNKNQSQFESMLIMHYDCVGVGKIKMTVGVRRSDKKKVQYCITAMNVDK